MSLLDNTVEFYPYKDTPYEIEIDGQTLIPIRTIMRLYEPSFGNAQRGYYAEDIKVLCRKFKIPVIKPNGVYNIPCINKKFLDGILYIFRNNHYAYGGLIMFPPAEQEEAKRDVQRILMDIEESD